MTDGWLMRWDKRDTDDITLWGNAVGGSGDKGSRLGKHPEYVYRPPVPSSLSEIGESERAVCEEFESSPILEWTGFLEVSRGLTFNTQYGTKALRKAFTWSS